MENIAYLLLGGNLGNTKEIFSEAKVFLQQKNIEILNSSSLYQTSPWGPQEQDDFLNQIIKISTALSAPLLLNITQETESKFGRQRMIKYGERTLDIDILYFNDEIIELQNLIVPHPQIQNRRFTLVPLCELAPDFIHPVLKISNSQMLEISVDNGLVNKLVRN